MSSPQKLGVLLGHTLGDHGDKLNVRIVQRFHAGTSRPIGTDVHQGGIDLRMILAWLPRRSCKREQGHESAAVGHFIRLSGIRRIDERVHIERAIDHVAKLGHPARGIQSGVRRPERQCGCLWWRGYSSMSPVSWKANSVAGFDAPTWLLLVFAAFYLLVPSALSTMSVSGVLRSKTWISKPSSRSALMASSPSFSRVGRRGAPRSSRRLFSFGLGLAETGNHPAKGLFHVREIRNRAPDDDVLDAGQGAHFLGQHFDGPIRRIA